MRQHSKKGFFHSFSLLDEELTDPFELDDVLRASFTPELLASSRNRRGQSEGSSIELE
jgi:hypothetical protein